MQVPPEQDTVAEVELISGIVARYFPIYETKVSPDSILFHCRVDPVMMEENFNRLREELGSRGYTPIITYKGGEHILIVGKLPEVKPRGVWVNIIMLVLTILTTVTAGMFLWREYIGETSGPFFTLDLVLMGALTFSLPLMGILGIHEMGHYLIARRRGIPASLPFFIPVPPNPYLPLGTFGAFISIRAPMPDRKTLFDLGVTGPIVGFLVTIPVAIVGLLLTTSEARPLPLETGNMVLLMTPLIYELLGLIVPISTEYALHPTAFAAWVGFLITALNLLPAGSLDGGHIARAIFGQNAKYVSWASVIGLIILGVFYTPWMIFALIILFLGIQHSPPLNDLTLLSPNRKLIGLAMAGILIVSFVPIPLAISESDYGFDAQLQGDNYANISASLNHTFIILIDSTGNMNTTLGFELAPEDNEELSFSIKHRYHGENISSDTTKTVNLTVKENVTVYFTILLTSPIVKDKDVNLSIAIYAVDAERYRQEIPIHVREIAGNYDFSIIPESASMSPGETKEFTLAINSSSLVNISLNFTVIMPFNWNTALYFDDAANATNYLEIFLGPMENISCTLIVKAPVSVSEWGSGELNINAVSPDVPGVKSKVLLIAPV